MNKMKKWLLPVILIAAIFLGTGCTSCLPMNIGENGFGPSGNGQTGIEETELNGEDVGQLFTEYHAPQFEKYEGEDGEAFKETVSMFLSAYAEKDPYAGRFLMNDTGEEISYEGAAGIIAESLTFTILDVYTYGTGYGVEVTIETKDFGGVYDEIIAEMRASGEEADGEMIAARFEDRLQTTSLRKTFTVMCVLYADPTAPGKVETLPEEEAPIFTIRILMTPMFSNAICGGMPEYIAAFQQEMLGISTGSGSGSAGMQPSVPSGMFGGNESSSENNESSDKKGGWK